jgi:hypothetical protein
MGDRPFAQNIVPESYPIVPQIAQCAACNQSVHCSCRVFTHIEARGTRKGLFRKGSQHPRPVPVPTVGMAIGRTPPLLGHVNFCARGGLVLGPTGEASKSVQVAAYLTRGVVISQEMGEALIGCAQLIYLVIAQFADRDERRAPKSVESVLWQPVRLLNGEVTPGGRDDGKAGGLGSRTNKIDDGSALVSVEEVEVVNEERGTAIGGEVYQQLAHRAVKAQRAPHRHPSFWDRPTGAERDDPRLSA